MKNNKFIAILVLIFLLAALTSCSPKQQAEPIKVGDDEVFQEPIASAEVVSREAVFIYGEQENGNPREIILTLNAQPLLLGQSYIRLAGVVSGERKIALVEVGGRGSVLDIGDSLSGYRVSSIQLDNIVLVKEKR